MNTIRTTRFVLFFLIFTFFAACGKKEETKLATQVAAKVNNEEITVHQVNSILSRNPNVSSETAELAKQEILARLVDQQLAKQQAIEKKLDRSPQVMQAIEAARNDLLARAYLDQIASAQPKPTPDEVKNYYKDHPELFASRRIFDLEEIVVQNKEATRVSLKDQTSKMRSIQEIANWLKSQDVKFTANRGVRAAEQIPLELLPKLQASKDGDLLVMDSGNLLYIFRVVATKEMPVDEITASPRIQQFLFNRRVSEAIVSEQKRLKEKAEIQYLGEFSQGVAEAEKKLKAQTETKAKEIAKSKEESEIADKIKAETKAKSEAEADAKAVELAKTRAAAEAQRRAETDAKSPSKAIETPAQENIEKGLRGLK